MIRSRRQNFASLPQALSSDSENTHWNLSSTKLSCPWSIWDSFRGIQSHTHNWSFGWITIKIHNKIKYLKVPTYDTSIFYTVVHVRSVLKSVDALHCSYPTPVMFGFMPAGYDVFSCEGLRDEGQDVLCWGLPLLVLVQQFIDQTRRYPQCKD